jgi:hypothetical protein
MNEHTHTLRMPPVLTRAADVCPSCKAEFEAWLGEPLHDVAVALEIAFAVAKNRAARKRRRKPPCSLKASAGAAWLGAMR